MRLTTRFAHSIRCAACAALMGVWLAACSASLDEKLVGRWIDERADGLLEFFPDKTVLMVAGEKEHSGTWMVAGENRVKITIVALGTPTTLLLEDIVIDGETMSAAVKGARATMRRMADESQPLTDSVAQSKLNAKYASALKNGCALSPAARDWRAFAALRDRTLCEARLEVVDIAQNGERTATAQARLVLDWKPEAVTALDAAYDAMVGEMSGWSYTASPRAGGCEYRGDPPGVLTPAHFLQQPDTCVSRDQMSMVFAENLDVVFDQPLPPTECGADRNAEGATEESAASDWNFDPAQLQAEDCDFTPGLEERNLRTYALVKKGYFWQVAETDASVDFWRRWQKTEIPEGSEGPFPEACPRAPVSRAHCSSTGISPCVAGDFVYTCG